MEWSCRAFPSTSTSARPEPSAPLPISLRAAWMTGSSNGRLPSRCGRMESHTSCISSRTASRSGKRRRRWCREERTCEKPFRLRTRLVPATPPMSHGEASARRRLVILGTRRSWPRLVPAIRRRAANGFQGSAGRSSDSRLSGSRARQPIGLPSQVMRDLMRPCRSDEDPYVFRAPDRKRSRNVVGRFRVLLRKTVPSVAGRGGSGTLETVCG